MLSLHSRHSLLPMSSGASLPFNITRLSIRQRVDTNSSNSQQKQQQVIGAKSSKEKVDIVSMLSQALSTPTSAAAVHAAAALPRGLRSDLCRAMLACDWRQEDLLQMPSDERERQFLLWLSQQQSSGRLTQRDSLLIQRRLRISSASIQQHYQQSIQQRYKSQIALLNSSHPKYDDEPDDSMFRTMASLPQYLPMPGSRPSTSATASTAASGRSLGSAPSVSALSAPSSAAATSLSSTFSAAGVRHRVRVKRVVLRHTVTRWNETGQVQRTEYRIKTPMELKALLIDLNCPQAASILRQRAVGNASATAAANAELDRLGIPETHRPFFTVSQASPDRILHATITGLPLANVQPEVFQPPPEAPGLPLPEDKYSKLNPEQQRLRSDFVSNLERVLTDTCMFYRQYYDGEVPDSHYSSSDAAKHYNTTDLADTDKKQGVKRQPPKCNTCHTKHARGAKNCPMYNKANATAAAEASKKSKADKKSGAGGSASGAGAGSSQSSQQSALGAPQVREITTLASRSRAGDRLIVSESQKRSSHLTNARRIFNGHLEKLIRQLMDLEYAVLFRTPVSDAVAPNYSKIVAKPMDLKTMLDKARREEYLTLEQLRSDITLIVEASVQYNGENPITNQARRVFGTALALLETPDVAKGLQESGAPLTPVVHANIIIERLMARDGGIFTQDPRSIPGYKDKIRMPMCLEMMRATNRSFKYMSIDAVLGDVALLRHNCIVFNGASNSYSDIADALMDEAIRQASLLGHNFSSFVGEPNVLQWISDSSAAVAQLVSVSSASANALPTSAVGAASSNAAAVPAAASAPPNVIVVDQPAFAAISSQAPATPSSTSAPGVVRLKFKK